VKEWGKEKIAFGIDRRFPIRFSQVLSNSPERPGFRDLGVRW
jgi:hypothetical protein